MAAQGPAVAPQDADRVVAAVQRRFPVSNLYLREEGALEFSVARRDDVKEVFASLVQELKGMGYIAFMKAADQSLTLYVSRVISAPRFRRKLAYLLFVATWVAVIIQGWSSAYAYSFFSASYSPLTIAILYAIGLMGIIGIHELGHKVASSRMGVRSSLPYFIPGIPVLTPVPTFGAVIVTGEPAVNRDALFDLGFSGPISGLIVTIVVAIIGAQTSTLISDAELNRIVGALPSTVSTVTYMPSLLQSFIYLVSNRIPGQGQVLIDSPVGFAAWLGFLITFLNLLPAWQLDGGHMARALLGRGKHRIATSLAVVVLVILGFWTMAILIIVFSSRRGEMRPLDDYSPLSRGRKLLFLLVLALAVLSAPLPSPP